MVEALRRLDPLLDLTWNPRAFRTRQMFDAAGAVPPEQWEGRWQVIRYETPGLQDKRPYALILTWNAQDRTGKYPIVLADGPYAPVTQLLVEYMELYDRAQRHWDAAMEEQWKRHEAAERPLHDSAANEEASDKVFFGAGGRTAIGGAQGKAAPETVATFFGKGRRSADALATTL